MPLYVSPLASESVLQVRIQVASNAVIANPVADVGGDRERAELAFGRMGVAIPLRRAGLERGSIFLGSGFSLVRKVRLELHSAAAGHRQSESFGWEPLVTRRRHPAGLE